MSPSPSPSRASGPPRDFYASSGRPVRHLSALSDEGEHDINHHRRDEDTEDELDWHRSEESAREAALLKKRQAAASSRRRAPKNADQWTEDEGEEDEQQGEQEDEGEDSDGAGSHASARSRRSHSDRKRRLSGAGAAKSRRSQRGSPLLSAQDAKAELEREYGLESALSTSTQRKHSEPTAAQLRSQLAEVDGSSASTSPQEQQQGFCARMLRGVLRGLFWSLLAVGVVVGLMFLDASNSLNARSNSSHGTGSGGPDALAQLASSLVQRHPTMRRQVEHTLEPALRHHVDAFASVAGRGQDDAASAAWLSGGVGVLQAPKPLVLVFAVDDSAASAGGVASSSSAGVRALLSSLLELLRGDGDDVPLLDLGRELELHRSSSPAGKAVGAPWVRRHLSRFFRGSQGGVVAQALESIHAQMHEILPGLVPPPALAAGSATVQALRAAVERGVVLVPLSAAPSGSGSGVGLSRAAAEAFHLYADDVLAPEKRAAFVFVVDVGANAGGNAAEAVRRTLEDGWSRGATGASTGTGEEDAATTRDEVLRPLLSRLVRNVMDMRV